MPDAAARAIDGGISALSAAYRGGLDPLAVVDEVLGRIEGCDDEAIWIHVDGAEDLRARAKSLGEVDPDRRGPLWGVPFGVKDNIDVAGWATTAGLPGEARVAERSASAVERLQAAGAICVGKLNLDQLATGLVGTRSPFGTPRNPVDPTLIPGGSSSGSAVAVARAQVPFALGTDTAGSGRVPAAMCAVVGMKSPPGMVSTDGVVPASPSIDCVSTFASSVADAIAVERVLGAQWSPARGPFTVAVAAGAEAVGDWLAEAGHKVVEADLGPFHEAGDLLYGGPWLADRTAALSERFSDLPDGLVEVVARVLSGGHAYSGTEVFDAIRRLGELQASLAPWWSGIDVLVLPTVPWLPTLDEVAADPFDSNVRLGRNTTFANLLGLGAIAVPCSAVEGAPAGGVSVLGPPGHLGAVASVGGEMNGEAIAAGPSGAGGRIHVAVVGAHLRGQPLNHQLVDRGGELVARTTTSPRYRLYRLDEGPPVRPALERVEGCGHPIEVEVWSLDPAGLGLLVADVAPPLGIGSVELMDGRWVKGFVCETIGLADATDITSFGGWRRYLASRG